MTTPDLAAAWAVIASELPGEARPVAGWIDARVHPDLPAPWRAVRLVFALPAERVAGLRHWRHEAETWSDAAGWHVVAVEASVAARAVLVGEPTLADWAAGTPLHGAAECAGLLDAGDADSGARFERVEAWLQQVRGTLDS